MQHKKKEKIDNHFTIMENGVVSLYFKIILLGETRVGKTTLRRSYMGENLDHSYAKTIGVDFALKRTPSGGFQIWDIAGESTPNTIRSHLYGTSGIILLYDVTQPDTLVKLEDWAKISLEVLGDDLTVVLVANKIDLLESDAQIYQEDVDEFLSWLRNQVNGNVAFFKTSALTGNGVEEVFSWLLATLEKGVIDE